ncbi:hypothetical protein IM660_09340 [Ruania alkalisoli]|uniref:Uncharacterized protein n=1 Tax=Ruania alkalisoli TaxID=2779775 RepID=A0A7M1SXV7_9MICO|nr:hypothetical protein [Ruania alkalisoli]QOR72398.1 hypothetical protein IM660_09340 [Ruania alkalisoli]
MRALVLGARGATGGVVAKELRRRGHHVTPAGRTSPPDGVAIDLTTEDGWRTLRRICAEHDVVVNASGIEDPALVGAVGTTALADLSASGAYLAQLADTAPPEATVVRGVGLVPGLSTVLVAALQPSPAGAVDVAIVLGAGEQHGAAAVEWTVGLAGSAIHAPPERVHVRNLRERRRFSAHGAVRTYLRADFGDQVLVPPERAAVREYLALDSRAATVFLALVGRFPGLRRLLRHAPHLGTDSWSVAVFDRASGRVLSARGAGQSRATGVLAARAAEQVVLSNAQGVLTMADVVTLTDLGTVPGIELAELP